MKAGYYKMTGFTDLPISMYYLAVFGLFGLCLTTFLILLFVGYRVYVYCQKQQQQQQQQQPQNLKESPYSILIDTHQPTNDP